MSQRESNCAAAYLDLYEQKVRPVIFEKNHGSELLSRISAMLGGF
jgi:hypothetical protein